MKENNDPRKFIFGNERFGGSYTPGEFEFNLPPELSKEEFEEIFKNKVESLHRFGKEFEEHYFEDDDKKSKKEKLKPLSIRVKKHTKEFFKNDSILSPREVLELYENYNNGSEAFINSLLEDEKELKKNLEEIQEKLHNARLFKEKLGEIELDDEVLTDEDKILFLKKRFDGEIKVMGNQDSVNKCKSQIIKDIQIYNTLIVRVWDCQVLAIEVYTNAQPVIYYFKNEYKKEYIKEILTDVENYCSGNEIEYRNCSNIFKDNVGS